MVRIKELGESAGVWSQRAGGAAELFATRAAASGSVWSTNSRASQGNFQQAITATGIARRWAAGVAGGQGKYEGRLGSVGQQRYSQGVQAGGADWEAGFNPYHRVISGLNLGARRPRGDPSNYTRVQQVGNALNAQRLARMGTGA